MNGPLHRHGGGHLDDHPDGVLDEEAPHPPWLVGERMHNVQAAAHGLGVDGVDVADLDRDLRHDRCRGIFAYDADLGGRVARGHEGDDPAHVHDDLEAEQSGVEAAALVGGCRRRCWARLF
jgi:hypothetical protein